MSFQTEFSGFAYILQCSKNTAIKKKQLLQKVVFAAAVRYIRTAAKTQLLLTLMSGVITCAKGNSC